MLDLPIRQAQNTHNNMDDPTLPDDPNTQSYKSDFLAGKFASPTTETTTFLPDVNPKSGPQYIDNPIITPQQEIGFQTPSTEFISAPYAGGVDEANDKEHTAALRANQNYYETASRHHHTLAHAGRLADSADYLQESGGLNPAEEGALDRHTSLLAKYPGAMGPGVAAANENFKQIYNNHQALTGQGYEAIRKAVEAGHLTWDQVTKEQDGTPDYYTSLRLAAEQGGKIARDKIAASEETPEAKLLSKALDVKKILEPEEFQKDENGKLTDIRNPLHTSWTLQQKWADRLVSQYAQGHTGLKGSPAPIPPPGPSPEFIATQNRFKPPTVPAYKNSAPTNSNQYFSR